MKRLACLVLASALLLLNGAAATRLCACLEAIDKSSCCNQEMPCCEGGECKMHPDQSIKAELALDLVKSLDAVAALPPLRLSAAQASRQDAPVSHAPRVVRVRGPDLVGHSLRAPPVSV